MARLGAHAVFRPVRPAGMVEVLAAWSGGVARPTMEGLDGVPMCHPGAVDVVYDTIARPETLEVGARVLAAEGTLVMRGVHPPARWEWSPLYFKELRLVGSNASGVEDVRGVRAHGIEHYLDLAASREVDLAPMITHVFALSDWQQAFAALGDQARSGAIKVALDPSR